MTIQIRKQIEKNDTNEIRINGFGDLAATSFQTQHLSSLLCITAVLLYQDRRKEAQAICFCSLTFQKVNLTSEDSLETGNLEYVNVGTFLPF